MKRTTYILIGLFVAGFCMLVGGMFVMYCLGKPYFSNQTLIPQHYYKIFFLST